jgi:hypothetical protein
VDVSQLVTAGRRRVRARRWAGISGAGALTVVALVAASLFAQPDRPPTVALQPEPETAAASQQAPAVPKLPVSCVATLLPVPGKATSSYVAINADHLGAAIWTCG